MSQDNPVTGVIHSSGLGAVWTERAMCLAGIRHLRMRFIERNYGRPEKCGCQRQTRFPKTQEEAKLHALLLADAPAGRVRDASLCRLFDLGWLVWQPDTGGYLWAEVVEIRNVVRILGETGAVRPLAEWEELGRGDVSFRMCPEHDVSAESFSERARISFIRDLLHRNPNFSHINLVTEQALTDSAGCPPASGFDAAGLTVEKLRERLVPSWQSGDMAIQRFTAYTITRKDTSAIPSGKKQG